MKVNQVSVLVSKKTCPPMPCHLRCFVWKTFNRASLSQSKPKLLETWRIRNSSILFLDDCITSGTTARLCYEALVELGNHVDGLIWVSAGG